MSKWSDGVRIVYYVVCASRVRMNPHGLSASTAANALKRGTVWLRRPSDEWQVRRAKRAARRNAIKYGRQP